MTVPRMAATNILSEQKKFWLFPSCPWPHPQASAVSATDPPLRDPWVVKQLHFPLLCLFCANLKITAALNLCSPKFNKVQEIGRLWDSISECVLLSLCQQPRWSKKTQRRGKTGENHSGDLKGPNSIKCGSALPARNFQKDKECAPSHKMSGKCGYSPCIAGRKAMSSHGPRKPGLYPLQPLLPTLSAAMMA